LNFAEGEWFSASSVEAFQRCPRRWAWRRLEGVKTDTTRMTFGREVHDVLKNWLTAGELDPKTRAGACAAQGVAVLPPPRTEGLRVEEWFGVKIGGVLFRGIKDLEELERDPPRVTDHKTTRSLFWAKEPDALVDDLQACLYAADAMASTGALRCELRWIYYPTEGPPKAAAVVTRVVDRAEVEPVLARAVQAAKKMTRLRILGARALDLPPNLDSCSDYGGCEYAEHCGEVHVSEETLDDFLASLEKRPAAINPPPPADAAPKTVAAPPPAPEKARGPRRAVLDAPKTEATPPPAEVREDPRRALADALDAAANFLSILAKSLR
jgi:RecB family exonuclease